MDYFSYNDLQNFADYCSYLLFWSSISLGMGLMFLSQGDVQYPAGSYEEFGDADPTRRLKPREKDSRNHDDVTPSHQRGVERANRRVRRENNGEKTTE